MQTISIHPLRDQLDRLHGDELDRLHATIHPVAEISWNMENITTIERDGEQFLSPVTPFTDEQQASLCVEVVDTTFPIDARLPHREQISAGLRLKAQLLLDAADRVDQLQDE